MSRVISKSRSRRGINILHPEFPKYTAVRRWNSHLPLRQEKYTQIIVNYDSASVNTTLISFPLPCLLGGAIIPCWLNSKEKECPSILIVRLVWCAVRASSILSGCPLKTCPECRQEIIEESDHSPPRSFLRVRGFTQLTTSPPSGDKPSPGSRARDNKPERRKGPSPPETKSAEKSE